MRLIILVALLLVATLADAAPPRSRAAAARHQAAVKAFKIASGYPQGRPGYVVDHKIPLCAGGPDTPANMQWQPAAASYQKDAFERALCVALKAEGYVLVKRAS